MMEQHQWALISNLNSRTIFIMQKTINSIFLFLALIVINNCQSNKTILSNALFYTSPVEDAGIDSIGFLMRKHVIVVTGKETNRLYVHNAMNGELKQVVERPNSYPNGVNVINDELVLITERDTHQVSVYNTSMEFLGTFGTDILRQPYGITSYKKSNGVYRVFITDSYEYDTPKSDRIIAFDLSLKDETFSILSSEVFGQEILYQVESIMVDAENNTLLVADENKDHYKIAVLDLNSEQNINSSMQSFVFSTDPEGIALVKTSATSGYWISTEQSETDNKFHLFDRETFNHFKTIYLENVSNTDGIATAYMHGSWYLYAVDNDRRVAAFKLPEMR